jgi:solute carrier family 9 (sodium/hydrogen exchanger), member 8
MFAVLGTIISTLAIAAILYLVTTTFGIVTSFQPTLSELLTFGALISTTDPVTTLAVFQIKCVDPQLFYLVFGESVLNDAIGLVLFQEFSKLLVPEWQQKSSRELISSFTINFLLSTIGSPLLGTILALAIAYLFKCIDMRRNALLELALYIFLLYVPYLLGEIFGLSGIVAVLFAGITAKTYVVPNLSGLTNINSDFIFRLIAFLSETAIFLELGLSIVGLTGSFHFSFIVWTLLACLLGRAANIYPLAALHNWTIQRRGGVDIPYEKDVANDETTALVEATHPTIGRTISLKTQMKMFYASERTPSERGDLKIFRNCTHMLWFAGLRGAVAYACVRNFPDINGHRDSFIMTAMMIILITVFVLGSLTESVLSFLDIETDVCEDTYMNTWTEERSLPVFMLRMQAFIERHVQRSHNENDDDVFVRGDNNTDKTVGQTDNPPNIYRRSSVTVTKSVRWETSGMYDYGMD